MKRGLRWSLAGVVGLVVVVSLMVIPALGEGPVVTTTGTLRLHLNSDGAGDRVIYDPVASGSDVVQFLSQSSCKLASSGAQLVEIVGSGQVNKKPFAGLRDHRIGVGQQGEGTGEPCARINRSGAQTQVLTLRIHSDPESPLFGQSIGYAEIDLGFKFDGDAVLELRKGGPSGTVVDTVTVSCFGGSDCGPDSGATDNERVVLYLEGTTAPPAGHWRSFAVNGVFDTIVLKPGNASLSGAISLEGGFDGSPPGPVGATLSTGSRDSLFQLVEAFDGEIKCDFQPEVLGGGDNPTFEIRRGRDTNGGCKGPVDGLLYNFEAGDEEGGLFVDFVADPVDANPLTMAQFLEVITWTFDHPPAVPGQDQFHTLSYDDHLDEGVRIMPWCLRDPRVGGALPAPIDTTTVLPNGHTSCLIQSTSYVTTSVLPMFGKFVVEDTIYNIGDGKRVRN